MHLYPRIPGPWVAFRITSTVPSAGLWGRAEWMKRGQPVSTRVADLGPLGHPWGACSSLPHGERAGYISLYSSWSIMDGVLTSLWQMVTEQETRLALCKSSMPPGKTDSVCIFERRVTRGNLPGWDLLRAQEAKGKQKKHSVSQNLASFTAVAGPVDLQALSYEF